MIAVICNSKRFYDSWLRGIEFEDVPQFRFVNSLDSCRGVRFSHVIHIVEYYLLQGIDDIYEEALTRVH